MTQVILLSTKAGALGINFVAAHRMIIFDEPWNPVWNAQVRALQPMQLAASMAAALQLDLAACAAGWQPLISHGVLLMQSSLKESEGLNRYSLLPVSALLPAIARLSCIYKPQCLCSCCET